MSTQQAHVTTGYPIIALTTKVDCDVYVIGTRVAAQLIFV